MHASVPLLLLSLACTRARPVVGDTGGEPSAWDAVDTEARFAAWVDWADARVAAGVTPGYQLAVAFDGKVQHTAVGGVTRLGGATPMTRRHRFPVGEVSMAATALLVHDLAEEGALDLDAPVTEAAADFTLAEGYDPSAITLRQALTHRAGLPSVLTFGDFLGYERFWRLWELPLWTEPGVVSAYSPTGYVLAAHAVESVTGQPYRDVLAARVLEPLGMTGTGDARQFLWEDHVIGTWRGEAVDPADHALGFEGATGPAGLYTTAPDLARMMSGLMAGGGPVEAGTLATMTEPVGQSGCLPGMGWGSGFIDFPDAGNDLRWVMQYGDILGAASFVGWLPDSGLVVAVTLNDVDADPVTWGREGAYRMLGITDPGDWVDRTPPSDPESFVGTWSPVDMHGEPVDADVLVAPGWSAMAISMSEVGDGLLYAVDGGEAHPATHHYGDCYSLPELDDVTVWFLRDEEGAVERLMVGGGASAVQVAPVRR